MKTQLLLLPALAASLFAAAPALADENAATRQVGIDRAELMTQAGAQAVHARITSAAQAVCRAENRGGAAFEMSMRVCVEDTVARTVAAVDAPVLTAHHLGESARIRLASDAP